MVIMVNKDAVYVVDDEAVSTYQNKGCEILITDIGFRNHPEYVDWKVFNHIDTIYPLTIKADRYSGVYSGGEYTAWPHNEADIPEEVFGDDVSCAHEWGIIKSERWLVGIGCTPSVALVDLYLKQHSIFVEDYLYTVDKLPNGIALTLLNERPILIDFGTAKKIAELMDSKAGSTADVVTDNDTDEDKSSDSDHDPASIALIDFEDISTPAELIANDIENWNRINGTKFDVYVSQGELDTVEVRIVDIRHPKLTTTLYWEPMWTYNRFLSEYMYEALREITIIT